MLRYIFMIPGAEAAAVLGLPELAIFWCDTGLAVSFFLLKPAWLKDRARAGGGAGGWQPPPPPLFEK